MSNLQNEIISEDLRDRLASLVRGLTPAVIDEFNGLIGRGELEEATELVQRLEREFSEWPPVKYRGIEVEYVGSTDKIIVKR